MSSYPDFSIADSDPRKHIPNWTVTDPDEWAERFWKWFCSQVQIGVQQKNPTSVSKKDVQLWFEMAIFAGHESHRLVKYPFNTGTLEEVLRGRRFAVLRRKAWKEGNIVVYIDGIWKYILDEHDLDGFPFVDIVKDIYATDWEHVQPPK